MFSFTDTTQNLFQRGISFNINEYLFALNVVFGENVAIAYAICFDKEEYQRMLGSDDEEAYMLAQKTNGETLLAQKHMQDLTQELEEQLTREIQNKSLNLKDYHFTGGQIAQILQNLLHNRISDLDAASTKDVISLIKMLTEQFGLDGGGDFEKHFVQIYPKFNALCPNCNREIDIQRGITSVCPFCGIQFTWSEEENRFYPQPSKL